MQVLFNQELRDVAQGQVELSQEQCNRIERLAQMGKASAAEVADARARVAQDRMTLVQTDNDYHLSLLDLAQLIELDSPEGFVLEAPQDTLELQLLANPEIFTMRPW